MSAGTLALTNGSTTVTGSSTVFQTDLAVNDFIVCKIGGTTYTLGVSTIGSNTALTLTQPFSGPTTTGVAWYAVPNQTLVGITTELAANLTTVYRSVLVNDANWTKVFSQSGNITITLKDGTTYTGPSWNSITTTLSQKMDKTQNLNDLADKAAARGNLGWVNGYLPLSLGGTGAGDKAGAWAAIATYGTIAGTAAQGNDTRLNTVNGKSGGTISSAITVTNDMIVSTGARPANPSNGTANFGGRMRCAYSNVSGRYTDLYIQENVGVNVTTYLLQQADTSNSKLWSFVSDGNAFAQGTWQSSSDERLKTNIKVIEDPLAKMRKIRGCSWDRLDGVSSGRGFIAQAVQEIFPEAVVEGMDIKLKDDTLVKKTLSVDVAGVSAALHHEAILSLMDIIEALGKRVHDIDGLDG